jgi:hypothetical protein
MHLALSWLCLTGIFRRPSLQTNENKYSLLDAVERGIIVVHWPYIAPREKVLRSSERQSFHSHNHSFMVVFWPDVISFDRRAPIYLEHISRISVDWSSLPLYRSLFTVPSLVCAVPASPKGETA